jgi:hypothetical protein
MNNYRIFLNIIKNYPLNDITLKEIKFLLKYGFMNENIIYFKSVYPLLLERKILTKKICYNIKYFDAFNFLLIHASIKPSNYMFLKIMRCKNYYVIPVEHENINFIHIIHDTNIVNEQLFKRNFNSISDMNMNYIYDFVFSEKLLIFTDDYINKGYEMIYELENLFCLNMNEKRDVHEIINIDNNVKKRINALMFIKSIQNMNTIISKVFNNLGREIITFL